MTVPTHFRRSSEIPGILVLHYANLPDEDVQASQGFKYTRPLRTILDLIEADTVERVFLRQALGQALHRGLIGGTKVPLHRGIELAAKEVTGIEGDRIWTVRALPNTPSSSKCRSNRIGRNVRS